MSCLHQKVKCLDRSVCTGSTNKKSNKTWWEWSKLMQAKYMCFGGWFVPLEAYVGWNDNIHNESQLFKVGSIHIQEANSAQESRAAQPPFEPRIPEQGLSFQLSGMWIRGVREPQLYTCEICGFATNKWACISYFDTHTQYCLVYFDCQMGLANTPCWICHYDMPMILWCTRESWAHIVITDQSLHICRSQLP